MSLELWESLKGIMDKFREHSGKTGETHETIRGNTGKQEDCVALYEIMEHARARTVRKFGGDDQSSKTLAVIERLWNLIGDGRWNILR